MARDYEDIHGIEDLDDDELRALVRDRLADHVGVDPDNIEIEIVDRVVHLEGRVGTEQELRMAEHVITDQLGLEVDNELVVDALRRPVGPAAIDDHLAEEDSEKGLLLGDAPPQYSDEAYTRDEHLDQRLFGSTDLGLAIAEGTTWNPPEGPTPEGLSGTDPSPGAYGEDH